MRMVLFVLALCSRATQGAALSYPQPADGVAGCTLTDSGPVVATTDGQVIENLRIVTTTKEPGIYVLGKKGVVIRNCTL